MLKLFKRKSIIDKKYDQYEKLMKDAHNLSTSNRAASDQKHAEANKVLIEIEKLKAENQ